ncbi:hypothetical protein HDU99_005003, partial [Rhizoclosmatium hyalinum]
MPSVILPGGYKKSLDAKRTSLVEARTSVTGRQSQAPNRESKAYGRKSLMKHIQRHSRDLTILSTDSISQSNQLASVESVIEEADFVRESEYEEGRVSVFPDSRKQSFATTWVPPLPSKLKGRVLTEAEKEERAQKRLERMQEHVKFHDEVLKMRLAEKEYRMRVKHYIQEKMEERLQDIDGEKGEDQIRREMYRARVAKEYEDASKLKLQQEMQRAAELAALEGAAEEQAKDAAAAKKKGK